MNILQPLPSEATSAGDFARQLALLLGPAFQPADGTRIAADLLALGGGLAAGYATNLASVGEAFADTASALLTELEVELGLPVRTDLATAARRTRLLAKVRAKFAGTPQDLKTTAATYDATSTVVENTPATVPHELDAAGYWGASRGVFQFAVKVAAATANDPVAMPTLQAAVEQQKSAHTLGSVCVTTAFLCDDAASLTDRDTLGS